MARKLSRFGFFALLILVGFWLVVSMPSPRGVGETPSSGLIRFSIDHSTTEIHRHRQEALTYHHRARRLLEKGSDQSQALFRRALNHYNIAQRLAAERPEQGYLNASIRRGANRVRSDLKELTSTN